MPQDFKPSYKENLTKSNGSQKFTEFLDSKTNTYSNYKYGFAISFPKNWTINKGVSEHTIIRGSNSDSLISISVGVIELNLTADEKSLTSIWPYFDSNKKDYELKMKSQFKSYANSSFDFFNIKKIYVYNIEAIQTDIEYTIKHIDFEYTQKVILYQLYKSPFMITLSLNIPRGIFDLNPVYYKKLLDKFTLVLRK